MKTINHTISVSVSKSHADKLKELRKLLEKKHNDFFTQSNVIRIAINDLYEKYAEKK